MMRFIVICLALGTASLQAQSPAGARASDKTAIRELVRQYVNARELRDAASIGALFTADADQHTTAGEWRRGRDAIVPGTLASSTRNPGRRSITVENVRFIAPEVAIADGPYEIAAAGGGVRRMWTTIVAARDGDTWRIAAIRNMVTTGAQ